MSSSSENLEKFNKISLGELGHSVSLCNERNSKIYTIFRAYISELTHYVKVNLIFIRNINRAEFRGQKKKIWK